MWVGIKGIISKRAGKTDKGIATLRAKNGKIVISSKGKRGVLLEHYRKLGTPKTSNKFDMEFEKEIKRVVGNSGAKCVRGKHHQVLEKSCCVCQDYAPPYVRRNFYCPEMLMITLK